MASTPDFESIVAEYGPLISRIAQSYEADPSLRQDMVQQILLAVWQALPTWRGDASLKTFVTRIAQNRSISHVARSAREPRAGELPEDLAAATPSPEERLNEASERRLLIEATRQLPLPQREVVVLVLEGFSYAEIGEMLGIDGNALSLRLSRAKAALKSMLEQKR
jgi:RNA polymerase sigma factor (sigma-70 family)